MLRCYVFAAGHVVGALRRDDRGVTVVECGLILALVAGLVTTGLLLLGPVVGGLFSNSASCGSATTGCTSP
jgi:Flp pilus assembly pilin Flp